MASLGLVTSRRLLRLTRLAVSVRHQSVVRPSPDQRLGPDRVLPANSLTTTWPDGAVLIREHTDHESRAYPPKSVWTMLQVGHNHIKLIRHFYPPGHAGQGSGQNCLGGEA